MTSSNHKTAVRLSLLIVAACIVFVFAYILLLLWPSSTFTANPNASLKTKKRVAAGTTIQFVLHNVCNHGVSLRVTRQLVNRFGGYEQLPQLGFPKPLKPGCTPEIVASTLLPNDLPAAEWQLKIVFEYDANIVRNHQVTVTTPWFETTGTPLA